MIDFIKKNKLEFFFLAIILVLGFFLRAYRVSEYLTFLGDEGRDVRIVRDLITKGNLVFIGPQTSVGNMYLGPLYYYLIAPSLALFNLNPVGPALMNVFIGTLTILGVWFVGRRWFGTTVGVISSLLYALSPVAIIYSRSSWNPNPTPFFALICAYGIYRVWQKKEFKWLPWVGLSFGFALQMHYLALLLVPFLGVYWLITLLAIKKDRIQTKKFITSTVYAFLIFLILMSPLFFFDMKHQGMNFNAFKSFFSDRQTTVNLNPTKSDRFVPVMITMVTDLVLARQSFYPAIIGVAILIACLYFLWSTKGKKPLVFILTWILFSILGLGVYKQHVYIHYLGFVYPAVYLLLGYLISGLLSRGLLGKLLGLVSLLFLVYLNIEHTPVKESPNRQLQLTQDAVNLVIKESKGEKFNFGLIAKQNYDESYRYFFENNSAKMVRGEDAITDQLFVICEDGDKCQPEGNPAYQIAIFGPATTTDKWELRHLKIYRLVHKK